MKLLVVLAVLLVVTNGFKTTVRRQFTSSLSSSNTAVTSTPTSSTPQETVSNILNQLRAVDPAKAFETISKVVQKPQRLQYTASMMTRFSFFLLQGVFVSFLRSSAKVSEGANQPAQKTPIDPLKIVNALSAAILSDDDSDVYVLGWYYTVMIMIRKLFRYLTVVVVVKV